MPKVALSLMKQYVNERRYGWVVNVVYIRNAVILSFLKREGVEAVERGVVEKEQRER